MQIKVAKFGGSSLADAAQFRKVAAIVKAEPERHYVVASAPGKRFSGDVKVTDMLLQCYEDARDMKSIDGLFQQVKDRYQQIIDELGLSFSLEEDFDAIRSALQSRHSGRDYVASRGEYLNSKILAVFLGFEFIDAAKYIFFREDGTLDSERTNENLGRALQDIPYAVVPGFYGSMPNGTIKTFSRGGSDVTGSIVARAVSADLYENWTDVSGMLMADPRCVENPAVIDLITYKELRELSYMGATVLHEDAVFPVRIANIPINIRNTNRPEDPGTMIVAEADQQISPYIITGVSGKKGFSIINVEKDMMNSEVGFGLRVLEVLAKHNVSFEHMPTGIDTLSVVVNTNAIAPIRGQLIAEIARATNLDSIMIEDGLALVAIVGRGMRAAKGTAARVCTALSEAGINIKMLDQGSSELNIILGIDDKDLPATLNAIYSAFVQ